MENDIFVELENKGMTSLVVWVHGNNKFREFVVCHYYDDNAPAGHKWERGHYFRGLEDALEYFKENA